MLENDSSTSRSVFPCRVQKKIPDFRMPHKKGISGPANCVDLFIFRSV